METGERRREKGRGRKSLCSSGLRSPVSILRSFRSPFSVLLLLTVFIVPIFAVDINKPVVGLASGVTIDIAPFGVEQIYFTAQGSYTLPGALSFSLRPSFSLTESSKMFRIPLVLNLSMFADKNEFIMLSCYLGGGMEVYRSAVHNTDSMLLTGGFTIAAGSFFIDIPVVRACRSYNTDSDIAMLAGLYFQR